MRTVLSKRCSLSGARKLSISVLLFELLVTNVGLQHQDTRLQVCDTSN